MNRAFIFGYLEFPHGSASANYVHSLAHALLQVGYEPWVISSGHTHKCTWDVERKAYYFDGIYFIPYRLSGNKLMHYLDFHFSLGYQVVNHLKECGCSRDDIIVAYSQKPSEMEPVFRYARNTGITSIACVTELFPQDSFRFGRVDPYWWDYHRGITHSLLMADKLWPISHYISDYLSQFGCDTMILPPMVDSNAVNTCCCVRNKDDDAIKVIYSGNGLMKDSLDAMIQTVAALDGRPGRKIEFHLTGVPASYFAEYPQYQSLLGTAFILHDWMSYEELQHLYSHMDFLLLAREINQVTLANFPSKVPEAMMFGVIPIVSNVGEYTKYYLEDGKNSIIFDGASVESCVFALERVRSMSNEDIEELSENARIFAEERFDYRNWVNSIKLHINGANR